MIGGPRQRRLAGAVRSEQREESRHGRCRDRRWQTLIHSASSYGRQQRGNI